MQADATVYRKKEIFCPWKHEKKTLSKVVHNRPSPRPTQILDIFHRNLPARDLSIMILFSIVLWVFSELGFIANFKRMWISILYYMSLLESVS